MGCGVEGLDEGLAGVLDGVFAGEGAEAFGAADEELVFVVGGVVDEVGDEFGVGGDDDRGGLVALAAGEVLPKLFGDVGEEGRELGKLVWGRGGAMKGTYHGETTFDRGVERLLGTLDLLLVAALKDSLRVLDVGIAEEFVEVLVRNLSGEGELSLLKVLVDLLGAGRELVEDPSLWERLLTALGDVRAGSEIATKSAKDILCRLVDLVAETAVSSNGGHVERDVSTTGCVANKCHTNSL